MGGVSYKRPEGDTHRVWNYKLSEWKFKIRMLTTTNTKTFNCHFTHLLTAQLNTLTFALVLSLSSLSLCLSHPPPVVLLVSVMWSPTPHAAIFSFFLMHCLIFFSVHLYFLHAFMFPPLFVSFPSFYSFFNTLTSSFAVSLISLPASSPHISYSHYPSFSKVWTAITRCRILQSFLLLSPCRWAEAVPGGDPRHRASAGDSSAVAQRTPQPPRQLPAHLHHPRPHRLRPGLPRHHCHHDDQPADPPGGWFSPGNVIVSRRKLWENRLLNEMESRIFLLNVNTKDVKVMLNKPPSLSSSISTSTTTTAPFFPHSGNLFIGQRMEATVLLLKR